MKFSYLEEATQKCPLCGGSSFEILKKNDRYGMGIITVGCKHCGLIQTNPRPTEEGLIQFYRNDYRRFYQNTHMPSLDYIQKNNKHTRMAYTVDFIKKITNTREVNKILDIGCSEGAFFTAIKECGFKGGCYGVEPNREFANFAEMQTGAKVFPSVEAINEEFDLIVLSHVFEHFLSPEQFLQKIKRNISENGLLYIDVPDAAEYKTLADLHIAHLYHYTTSTLKELMRLNGYQVVKCESHCPPYHPKSIRIVVQKSKSVDYCNLATNMETECEAWSNIRKIGALMYLLKRKIAGVHLFRKIYHHVAR